ncbi:unnamed protein product [Lampetra planeri]
MPAEPRRQCSTMEVPPNSHQSWSFSAQSSEQMRSTSLAHRSREPATCIYSLAGAATADHTTSPEGSCLYSVVNVENTRRKKKKSKEKSEHEDASGIYSLVNADSG